MAAHQAPPSLGFSRQEHWSGLPFPSPMHESGKWKWRRSVVPDSSWPRGRQPTRLLRPWDFPGKSNGVGCHCLLHRKVASHVNLVLLATELSCWSSSLLLWLIFNTLIIQIDWTTLRKWQVKIFSLKTKALHSCPMWIELQIQTTDSSMQWFIFLGGGCCDLLVLICFEELEQY